MLILLACVAFQSGCSQKTIAGGTSTSENARVSGSIVDPTGIPVAYAIVQLIPASYNPVTDSPSAYIKTDTTDSAGHYLFDSITTGSYNISAVQPSTGKRLLTNTIAVVSGSVNLDADTLHKTGTVKITISDTVKDAQSYVYIPGTTISISENAATYDSGTVTITIDSVPAGTIPAIYYVKHGTSQPQHIGTNIHVWENDTVKVDDSDRRYRKILYLNTSATCRSNLTL